MNGLFVYWSNLNRLILQGRVLSILVLLLYFLQGKLGICRDIPLILLVVIDFINLVGRFAFTVFRYYAI